MSEKFNRRFSYRENKKAYLYLAFSLASYLMIHFFRTEGLFDPDWRKIPMDISRNLSIIGFTLFFTQVVPNGKWYSSLIQLICSTIGILILIDLIFLFILHPLSFNMSSGNKEVKIENSSTEPSFSFTQTPHGTSMEEENLGFRNRANETIRSEVNINGKEKTIYYVFDGFGRRVNRSSKERDKSKYAIFMGCSVTLGQHVDESVNLPAWFEKVNPEFRSYNYGISASGPNQYLAWLQEMNLKKQVPENNGIFIYPFFEFHVNRAISDFEAFQWNHMTPYYEVENDHLIRNGNFDNGRRLRTLFFDLLSESYFIKYIDFNYPRELRPGDYDYTARLIAEMKKEYTRQSGNDNFFVFLMPGFETNIIPYLEKYEIDIINELSAVEEYFGTEYAIPIDQHPTGKFYELMADSLSKEISRRHLE